MSMSPKNFLKCPPNSPNSTKPANVSPQKAADEVQKVAKAFQIEDPAAFIEDPAAFSVIASAFEEEGSPTKSSSTSGSSTSGSFTSDSSDDTYPWASASPGSSPPRGPAINDPVRNETFPTLDIEGLDLTSVEDLSDLDLYDKFAEVTKIFNIDNPGLIDQMQKKINETEKKQKKSTLILGFGCIATNIAIMEKLNERDTLHMATRPGTPAKNTSTSVKLGKNTTQIKASLQQTRFLPEEIDHIEKIILPIPQIDTLIDKLASKNLDDFNPKELLELNHWASIIKICIDRLGENNETKLQLCVNGKVDKKLLDLLETKGKISAEERDLFESHAVHVNTTHAVKEIKSNGPSETRFFTSQGLTLAPITPGKKITWNFPQQFRSTHEGRKEFANKINIFNELNKENLDQLLRKNLQILLTSWGRVSDTTFEKLEGLVKGSVDKEKLVKATSDGDYDINRAIKYVDLDTIEGESLKTITAYLKKMVLAQETLMHILDTDTSIVDILSVYNWDKEEELTKDVLSQLAQITLPEINCSDEGDALSISEKITTAQSQTAIGDRPTRVLRGPIENSRKFSLMQGYLTALAMATSTNDENKENMIARLAIAVIAVLDPEHDKLDDNEECNQEIITKLKNLIDPDPEIEGLGTLQGASYSGSAHSSETFGTLSSGTLSSVLSGGTLTSVSSSVTLRSVSSSGELSRVLTFGAEDKKNK